MWQAPSLIYSNPMDMRVMTSVHELPASQLLQSVQSAFSPLLDATFQGVVLILNLAISSVGLRHADESRYPVGDGGFLL